jgi:hypothetical protein
METYQKLQEEDIQYLAVFGEGRIGSILGGTKHSHVKSSFTMVQHCILVLYNAVTPEDSHSGKIW